MQIDRAGRWIDLKLVYWGPAKGGKTTSLRSLHGAFASTERGDLQSIETEEERTYFFDYAPLDLPKWRDHQIRVHAYTVPGQETYVETRRRILRGVDGVLFVADATPEAREATAASWRELDGALCDVEGGRRSVPVVLAVNKLDLPGADRGDVVAARLAEVVPVRRSVAVVETTAIQGLGVVKCFRHVLVAAAADHLSIGSGDGGPPDGFAVELEKRLGRRDDGLPVRDAPARRVVEVEASKSKEPDLGGLDAALEATRWLSERDLDARDLARRQALANLLLDVGKQCIAASAPDVLAASVLASIVKALGASYGWLGFTETGTEHVFDAKGKAPDASSVAALARVMGLAAKDGAVVPLDVPVGSGVRTGTEGKRGSFTAFSVGDGRRGFLLVLGADERGLPTGSEDVLGPAGAYVGLTVARLTALSRLREGNAALEKKVDERTKALRQERDSLEERVRERTRELEAAKRAALQAERVLLDKERGEAVRQLAAGLAHEVNNPVGAARANLDHAIEVLRSILPAIEAEEREETTDALEAIEDARRDIDRVASNVSSLFQDAAGTRRAVVKTPLAAVVRDALSAHAAAHPGSKTPALVESEGIACGVASGECARWVFRLLGLFGRDALARLRVRVERHEGRPCVLVESDRPSELQHDADLDVLRDEIETAGGEVTVAATTAPASARITLPRPVGETSGVVVERLG